MFFDNEVRRLEEGEGGGEIDTRKVEIRRRSSGSPNCIYGLDRGRRRNDIKTPVALRRGRCIICRRVVKRFQLVFPYRSSSAPTRARGGNPPPPSLIARSSFFS